MTIDRRKFLAGTALGAVTAVLLDKQEAKAINVSGYKPRFAMIFDQNKCVGCGACKEACSETNHVPVGLLRMTLERQSTARLATASMSAFPASSVPSRPA